MKRTSTTTPTALAAAIDECIGAFDTTPSEEQAACILAALAAGIGDPAVGYTLVSDAELERLRAIEAAARDVDSLWDGEDGKLIRWEVEAGEALEDLRAALADRSQAAPESSNAK